jgi:ABC-type transport system involved in multi-copper enzyme maturation permease subunit
MSIAGKTWKEVRALALLYVTLLSSLLVLALAYWPEAREILEKKGEFYRMLAPTEALKKFFQDAASHVESAAYAAYIGIQHYFKALSIVGIACAVLLGTGTIAKEKERGSFEFLASRPVSRTAILWPVTWVLSLCLIVPIFATSLIIPWLSPISGQTLPIHGLLQAAVHSSLFVEMFLLLTLLLSVLMKTQVQVATGIGALVIFQVGIFFVPGIRNTSIFKLTDYEIYQFMVPGNLDYSAFFWSTDIWLVLANVVLFFTTLILFRKRDLG